MSEYQDQALPSPVPYLVAQHDLWVTRQNILTDIEQGEVSLRAERRGRVTALQEGSTLGEHVDDVDAGEAKASGRVDARRLVDNFLKDLPS